MVYIKILTKLLYTFYIKYFMSGIAILIVVVVVVAGLLHKKPLSFFASERSGHS